jgi:hypothetical protein
LSPSGAQTVEDRFPALQRTEQNLLLHPMCSYAIWHWLKPKSQLCQYEILCLLIKRESTFRDLRDPILESGEHELIADVNAKFISATVATRVAFQSSERTFASLASIFPPGHADVKEAICSIPDGDTMAPLRGMSRIAKSENR